MKKSTAIILSLFAVSVSLNLFIAGFYLSGYLNQPTKQRYLKKHRTLSPSVSMRQLVSKLPENKKRLLKPYLHENKKAIRKTVQQHIKIRLKLYMLLRAETLDIPQIQKIIRQEKELKHQIDLISNDAFLTLLPKLTYKERLQLIDAIQNENRRGLKRPFQRRHETEK